MKLNTSIKIKNNLLKLCALLLFILPLATAAIASADTVEIRQAACAGSNITITTNPDNDSCKKIEDQSETAATRIAKTVVNVLTTIVGLLAVIMIIYAGFRYVSSGGSDEAVKGAKNTIIYAIIGLVVVALAQIIVHFVLAKTTTATTPRCVKSGKTHKWDTGPNAGNTCKP
jgi:amino acid transporter